MILIGIGANLPSPAGAPAATLRAALADLSHNDVSVIAVSPRYESLAWPDPRDPVFVNAVARIATGLSPEDLLSLLAATERRFGRSSGERNAPRPLDLDVLDYQGRVQSGPPALPHPRLSERGFVLVPLRDVAPGWRHPESGLVVDALIDALPAEARMLTRLPDPD
jgi:2-amino-4-hydroxy-6-hydroxymethyldihydropteridine diphosphokinase